MITAPVTLLRNPAEVGGERLASGVDDPVELDVPYRARAGVGPGARSEDRGQVAIDIPEDGPLPHAGRDGLLLERQLQGALALAGTANDRPRNSSPAAISPTRADTPSRLDPLTAMTVSSRRVTVEPPGPSSEWRGDRDHGARHLRLRSDLGAPRESAASRCGP